MSILIGGSAHCLGSVAIPAMPIYLALLFKVMKEQGTHEGCIEQIDGLFRDSLYGDKAGQWYRAASCGDT